MADLSACLRVEGGWERLIKGKAALLDRLAFGPVVVDSAAAPKRS